LQRKKQVLSKEVRAKESIADKLKIGLQSAWYKRGLLSFLASRLLWPLSQVYRFLAFSNRKLYETGVFKVNKVSVPVIVVGNIVAGGGGKTPTVIALAQHLQAQDIRVGVISRGYGRTSTECLEVKKVSKMIDVGDEPASIVMALNSNAVSASASVSLSVPVFVAKSRFEAASNLLKTYPATQVIVCDDGLQHHALQHDIAITVFDDRGLGNGLLLPAGPLRESRVKTTHSLVLHTGNQVAKLPDVLAPQFTARRALASYALTSDGGKIDFEALKGQTNLIALAGIANPNAFFEMLRGAGLNLVETIALPDHFAFNYDFDSALGSKYNGYILICTVKDALKLWQMHPAALAVPLDFAPEPAFFAVFDAMLKPLLNTHSLSST
jgi:tetraacyldisaccharide 4'-kinase